jgi:hypothetical protein
MDEDKTRNAAAMARLLAEMYSQCSLDNAERVEMELRDFCTLYGWTLKKDGPTLTLEMNRQIGAGPAV